MMKCPSCGHQMPEGNVFCENCGAKLVEINETEKHCPQCGAVVEEGAAFCEECGFPLQDTQEETPVSEQPEDIEEPSLPIVDTPAPPSEPSAPKGPSWFQRNKKKVIACCIALVLIAGGLFGGKVYLDYHYITQTVSLSNRLATTNKSLVDNVQQLSKATTEDDRNKAIAAIKENQTDLSGIIKDNSARFIPGKFSKDAETIATVLRDQETVYADIAFVIDNPSASDTADKITDLKNSLKQIKEIETTIDIPGADFSPSRDMDNLASYLNVYKQTLEKEDLAKRRAKMKPIVGGPSSNTNIATPDGAFRKYHQYLTSHNLHLAYNMFSPSFKEEVPYDGWAVGYNTTITSEPTMVRVTANDGSTATLAFSLKARDRTEDGGVYVKIYEGTCTMQLNNGSWQIQSINSRVMNEYKE